jgi:hypothetical protein
VDEEVYLDQAQSSGTVMSKQRFIVAEPEVCESLGIPFIVMLANIGFWNMNYDALKDWCEQNNSKVMGMTVEFPDAQTLTAFALRWT